MKKQIKKELGIFSFITAFLLVFPLGFYNSIINRDCVIKLLSIIFNFSKRQI